MSNHQWNGQVNQPYPCAPYNPPCPQKKKCKKKNCKKCVVENFVPVCPPVLPPSIQDPCPLKSFCDPGLTTGCSSYPLSPPICAPDYVRKAVTTWKVNYLVSNRPNQAAHLDEFLQNPWGIVIYQNQLWVANNMSNTLTNYDLFGNRLLGPVILRDSAHNSCHPTGLAVNCCGGFPISSRSITKSGILFAATEHGTVLGYNPLVNPQKGHIVINQQLTGRVHTFKGIAITNNLMYLADMFQRRIHVFDQNYIRLDGFPFVDGDTCEIIPPDYGPNNIVNIGCFMYVLWARQDPNIPIHDLDGPGNGYVSQFNLDGSFVRRFTSRGVLNSPWAMIPAPNECGFPPGSFLIGNNGDGKINIFDCDGRYVGPLLNQAGLPIVIEGLWGLAPHYTCDFNEIFFTAAPDEDLDGIVGSIIKDQIIYF